MNRDPFVLPGLPGAKTLADNLDRGALFEAQDGIVYSFRGLLPGGRWAMYTLDDDAKPFMLPDSSTGTPNYPTHEQMLAAMIADEVRLITSPLDSDARNRARGQEKTKEEVIEDDPFAQVRMSVCRLYDKERPAKDNENLDAWSIKRFDWEAIKKQYGKERPPASTLRSWINKRGRPGNRCWADMEDRRGQGPRAKRVTGHRLAIAVWHAVSFWVARRHPSVSKLWKDVEADTKAYNTGKALIMHDGVRKWEMPAPADRIKPADPEFFRQLVKRLEGRHSYKTRWSAQAAQQRWEGGGRAPEPVRYLEIVQQDETEVPGFFFIDAENRVPLGVATWVIAVDVYTRCILAWDLSFDAPSTVSWMRNVLNASKMKPLPREWAERFPQLSTIGGKISAIIYDNPVHTIAQHVEDAHGDLVQDVIYAGEGQPTHKALVERTHETLRGLFVAELPGAKMQIALSREFKMDPSSETLLTLQEARVAMARAVCKYHTTELTGLDNRTPLDVWVEQWNRWGPQLAADQDEFERAIGNVTFDRALDNGGIVHENLAYSDRELTPLLMEAYAAHSHYRRNTKKPTFDAKVKHDPSNMLYVSVFDPTANKYRKLKAKKERYASGLTLAMHKLVRRHRAAQSLMADPDGEGKLLELRRLAETELKQISGKMEIREQRARAAILQRPIIREMMGHDIELIHVTPSPTGMEVKHDMNLSRADALQVPVRGRRGSAANQSHQEATESVDGMDVQAIRSDAFGGSSHGASPDEGGGDASPAWDTVIEGNAGLPKDLGSGAARNVNPASTSEADDEDDVLGGFETY